MVVVPVPYHHTMALQSDLSITLTGYGTTNGGMAMVVPTTHCDMETNAAHLMSVITPPL